MMTRFEIKREESEFAEYTRHVEGGYEGTFTEWLSERLGAAPTEPPPPPVSGVVEVTTEIPF